MFLFYGITLLSFGITVQGNPCPTASHRHKIVKLGIFYSEKLFAHWAKDVKDSGQNALFAELTKLCDEVSNLFSVSVFKQSSAKFTIKKKNIHHIPQRYLEDIKTNDLFGSARRFCPVARVMRFIYDGDWDFAMLFVLDSEIPKAESQGSVASLDSFCTQKNCGIVISNGRKSSQRFFGIFPKLLAHELAHGFGVHHDYECRDEPCDLSGRTIMNSPGSPNAWWSDYSKRTFNNHLGMKAAYSCLEWACPALEPKPKEIFDDPHQLALINSICVALLNDSVHPFRLSDKKSPSQFNQFIKGFSKKEISYYKVWKSNPQWFLSENVCKGFPCRRPISKTHWMLFGFTAKELEGEPCDKGMVCRKGACVKK